MALLDKKQTNYLVNTLIPSAEQFVLEISQNPALLIDKQLINNDVCAHFLTTLVALPGRMIELLKENKFVINNRLHNSRVAQASTRSGEVIAVELRSELLDPDDINLTVVSRVRTLLHETSHTIMVDNAFPILDYCYAGGWAISHLGLLCVENADTFAEASMFYAVEPGLECSQGLFRTYNNAVAQQAVLREAGALGLSAALAWVDLRVNRAWLRMADYKDFANRAHDGTVAEMRRIEDQFLNWGIVQQREGSWWDLFSRKKLNAESISAVDSVCGSVNQVKDWVSGMQVRVVKDGDIDFIKDKSYILQIPLDALFLDTLDLGNAILEKIFAALAPVSKFPTQNDLLNLCVNNDRHPEKERLKGRWEELLATPATPPKDLNAFYDLDALLALAVFLQGANDWEKMAANFLMPKFEKHIEGVSYVSGEFAQIEQKLEDLKAAIGRLPQARDPLRASILDRRAGALNMLKLATKTMTDKATVVQKADANIVKGWIDFNNKVADMKFTD